MNYANEWDLAHHGRLMIAPHIDPRVSAWGVDVFGHLPRKDRRELHVLDVGCGTGLNTRWFAMQGCTVTGVDASPFALSRAQRLRDGSHEHYMLLDVTIADGWPKPFDAALDVCCLENLTPEEWAGALQSIGHALKPEGRFLSLCAHPDRSDTLTTAGKVYKPTSGELSAWLLAAGFGSVLITAEQHKDHHGQVVHCWHVRARKAP